MVVDGAEGEQGAEGHARRSGGPVRQDDGVAAAVDDGLHHLDADAVQLLDQVERLAGVGAHVHHARLFGFRSQ